MTVTITKRVEFSAARVVGQKESGDDIGLIYGHFEPSPATLVGHNYVAWFEFAGPIDSETGMICELSKVKANLESKVLDQFDHHVLNQSLDAFREVPPTVEQVALALFDRVGQVVASESYHPVSCKVLESSNLSATAWGPNQVKVVYPVVGGQVHLAEGFDPKVGLHCHRSSVAKQLNTLRLDPSALADTFSQCRDGVGSTGIQIALESGNQLEMTMKGQFLTVHGAFHASHCLENAQWSAARNKETFGRCTRMHGHQFGLNVTVELSDETQDYVEAELRAVKALADVKAPFEYAVLNELASLGVGPYSCERMVQYFYDAFRELLGDSVIRVGLQETPNNSFAVRSNGNGG